MAAKISQAPAPTQSYQRLKSSQYVDEGRIGQYNRQSPLGAQQNQFNEQDGPSISRSNAGRQQYDEGIGGYTQQSDNQADYMRQQSQNQSQQQRPDSDYRTALPSIQQQQGRYNAFQKASEVSLQNYDSQSSKRLLANNNKPATSEFFEKNFGNAEARKRQQMESIKNELRDELGVQIQMKTEKLKREKQMEKLEDLRAEEKYVKELKKYNEASVTEKGKKIGNVFAESVIDPEIGVSLNEAKRDFSISAVPFNQNQRKSVDIAQQQPIVNSRSLLDNM